MIFKLTQDPEFEVSGGGEGVTWEFWGFEPDVKAEVEVIDVGSAEKTHEYSNADFVMSTQTGTIYETYVKVAEDGLYRKGIFSENVFQTIHDEPSKTFAFPMSYGDSFEDEFEGSHDDFMRTDVFYRKGQVKGEVDGYGKLKTPVEEFENVIRFKIVEEYVDKEEKGGDTVNVNHDTTYTWFAEDISHEIASYSLKYVNGEYQGKEVFYMGEESATEMQSRASVPEMGIYPNPASRELTIASLPEHGDLTIYNLSGQEVINTALKKGQSNEIEIPDLKNGFYIADIKTESHHYNEKILIE